MVECLDGIEKVTGSNPVRSTTMNKYNPQKIEKKWQERWEQAGLYHTRDTSDKPKFYCLDMFPYPSGEGLHVGHWRGYVLSDVVARYQLLNGKNVLHPIGFDAFGLPAENAAIKAKSHPQEFTNYAISNFQKQLRQIGAMFDWSRELRTSDPGYYKWTQWLFLKLYKNGLAYRKKAPVNWCPSCQTVLANEQVISGECERCGSKVIKKDLTQWFFKITSYAEDLLNDLNDLDWPERVKTLQRNWIGKSEGAMVDFKVHNSDKKISVFTTRPDTLAGATFMVLAPEHELVSKITTPDSQKEVKEYIEKTRKISDIEREKTDKEKTGVFTGAYAINPITKKQIPIWISDYVLLSYGTGACMCVPAHDQRDFSFAKKFVLPILQVISKDDKKCDLEEAYIDDGKLINSGKYNGLKSGDAKIKIIEDLKKEGIAESAVNYRLRDWLISRQRYWGAPIPIVYCEKCGEVAVSEKDLPVELPGDVEFKPHGESPLKKSKSFLNTTCPSCKEKAIRETDTMDTFVDSSWYYLRYLDPNNEKVLADKKKEDYWLPVDLYIGGIEHAVLHLLYARFISKALHKIGVLDYSENGEPFTKLFNIGMIYLHGAKMSKSKGNVVSPDTLTEKYGTDALRGYELFIGPAAEDSQWQAQGITGVYRFLEKVWNFYQTEHKKSNEKDVIIEKAIKTVTIEIENIRPNTAISHLMELFNSLRDKSISDDYLNKLNILLAPFFPHLAEELWERSGHKDSIFNEKWPVFDEELVKEEKAKIAIQVNGKVKAVVEVNADATQEQVEKIARELLKEKQALQGATIKKVIYVPCRVLNFVVE